MYTDETPEHVIDLGLDEASRWREVIETDGQAAYALARQAMECLPRSPRLVRLAGRVFGWLYALSGGRYRAEMRAWAEAFGVTAGEACLLNCSYELSHFAELRAMAGARVLGCTAGARWVVGLGMVHARSLDWPLPEIGRATRLFRFVGDRHEFVSVGMPGFVGVLSGMVPGAYSVSLNWAPPTRRPTFDWGPAFLLREVLTSCATYDQAVCALSEARLSTSVFFLVCGAKRDQACVIERTRSRAAVWPMRAGVLVQANHHVAGDFEARNEAIADGGGAAGLLAFSSQRAAALAEGLGELEDAGTLSGVRAALTAWPVENEDSVQQMVFGPSQGRVRVWRLV